MPVSQKKVVEMFRKCCLKTLALVAVVGGAVWMALAALAHTEEKSAQKIADPDGFWTWTDATTIGLHSRGFAREELESAYDRLPAAAKGLSAAFSAVGLVAQGDRILVTDSQNAVRIARRKDDGSFAWDGFVMLKAPAVGGAAYPTGLAPSGGAAWVCAS